MSLHLTLKTPATDTKFPHIDARKMPCDGYTLPHFDYCRTTWGNCTETIMHDLIKLPKRVACTILNKITSDPDGFGVRYEMAIYALQTSKVSPPCLYSLLQDSFFFWFVRLGVWHKAADVFVSCSTCVSGILRPDQIDFIV